MSKLKWIIFVTIVVAIFGTIIIVNKVNESNFTGDATKPIAATEEALGDHIKGGKDEKVILIEYGDFQCPGCRNMDPTIKQLVEEYPDKLTLIFRNTPLTNTHPNALAAATAAEAAGLQNKFWEMNSLLYEQQDSWKDAPVNQRSDVFIGYAETLGLDVEKFKNDLRDDKVRDKINRDRSIGRSIGVDQTPTFVLNGQKLDDSTATDPDKLREVVVNKIKEIYPDKKPKKDDK